MAVRLKEIEARVVRLESARKVSAFAGMTEGAIEVEAKRLLDYLIGPDGSFAAVVAEMAASDEPDIRDGVRTTVEWLSQRYGYAPPPAA